jgi:hypothetical protein
MKTQLRCAGFVSLVLLSTGAIIIPAQVNASLADMLTNKDAIAQTSPAMEKPGSMMKKPDAMGKPDAMMKPNVGVVKSGKFVNAEHPTQGTAKIISDRGASFIEFDSAFKTDNGPDLYVILYRTSQPPIKGIQKTDYLSIGKLQKVAGMQRYAIPKNAKLSDYGSVAVWCQQFNATFGYAALK